LLLGCTHFPVLKGMLGRVLGTGVTLVDSAATTAAAMEALLVGLEGREQAPSYNGTESREQAPSYNDLSRFHFLATDGLERFARVGATFMGEPITTSELELVDL